ncbi:MAG: hypothetical protein ABIO70_00580 [Pseudomonadota bacterium]
MSTQHRQASSRRRPAHRVRHGGSGQGSDHDEQIKAMAKDLGNKAMQDRLARATGKRDALMAFIVERLGKVRDMQQREHEVLNRRTDWWRDLAWQQPGVWLPEPERWGPVARAYRQAAEALAAGHLTRGAQLLEQAMEAERATQEALPWGLGLRPEEDAPSSDVDHGPEAMDGIGDGEGCPQGELPAGIAVAAEVERFRQAAPEGRQIRVVPHDHPWWEEEEEEEEEGGKE